MASSLRAPYFGTSEMPEIRIRESFWSPDSDTSTENYTTVTVALLLLSVIINVAETSDCLF